METMTPDDIEEIKAALTSVADKMSRAYGTVNVMIIRTGTDEDDAIRSAFFYKWERDD